MKSVRHLILVLIIGACQSPRPASPNNWQYQELSRIDSLAQIHPDSSYYYYYRASEYLTDSSCRGTLLQRMALIQMRAGDYFGSNETTLSSLQLFNQKDKKHYPNISYNYNLLAMNCLELARYDDALRYYDLAIRYSDSSNIPYYITNKGVVYQKKKQYGQAIILYDSVLKNPVQDTTLYTRLLSNRAKAHWLQDANYQPADMLQQALHLRQLKNDSWGLNASYSHLADYYIESNPDSARQYAEKMYRVAKDLNSADDQSEALEKLIRLSSGSNIKKYFALYDSLTDSIHLARSNANNQFADIRFAAEEARADNLLLEKDNSEKKFRIAWQRVIIYSTLALFALAIILGRSWYKRKKRLQEIQTKTAIRESELKTSKKIHDVVANGLYRIMTDLEHRNEIEKEQLLDTIESLYEQSRDISYEKPSVLDDNFSSSLNNILASFATPSTRVITVGNNQDVWAGISSNTKKEIEQVLQELMVNMTKHSQSKNVAVNFERQPNDIVIHYKDDGIGLSANYKRGNGMRNTENRMLQIGGRIIFENNPEKGLNVEIYFPFNKTA